MNIKEIKDSLKSITHPNQLLPEWLNDERSGVQKLLTAWHKQYEKQQLKQQKHLEMLVFENQKWAEGYQYIAGLDEVGRGPLAGPVVCACVIMKKDSHLIDVNDSKKLSLTMRDTLYTAILEECVAYGIGIIDEKVIDEVNIYEATKLAMQQAVDNMAIKPDYLLIDAMTLNNEIPQEKIIKGDAKSYSIACASIIAKVTRDRLMAEYDKTYAGYGFAENAGYGTKQHLEALETLGVTPIHRQSFEPIKSMVNRVK